MRAALSPASEIKISFIRLTQTPPLCALLSPPPLPSVPFSWPLLLLPPLLPPSLSFLLSLSLLPCFSFPIDVNKVEGKSPGAGLWSSSAHTHPLHSAKREPAEGEPHWSQNADQFHPFRDLKGGGGGKRIPAALLVAAANATQTSGGGSEWHNWVSGGVISSAIVTNVTLTSWPRDCCDYGAQSRHAHSSLEAGGIQWSKNTSPSAGKRHRCSKRQQTLQ